VICPEARHQREKQGKIGQALGGAIKSKLALLRTRPSTAVSHDHELTRQSGSLSFSLGDPCSGGTSMSGRIAKSQIPILRQSALTPDARTALIEVKNHLKAGGTLKQFGNYGGNTPLEGPPLPDPSQGCIYYEKQVGHARAGDPQGEAGSKRLVIE